MSQETKGYTLDELIWLAVKRRIKIAIQSADVKEVDKDKETCTLLLPGDEDLCIYNVRLRAVIDPDADSRLIVFPKVGSSVAYGMLDNIDTEYFVMSCSEVESVLMEIGKTKVLIDKDKIDLITDTSKLHLEKDLIAFNNGNKGGIPEKDKVKANDTSIKNYVTAMKTAISAALTTIDTAAGSVSVNAFNTAMAAVSMNVTDVDNPKVKH